MKKINYLLLGAAGLLMASCSQEEVVSPAGEGFAVTVKLPADVSTRAFSDGFTAKNLHIAIYDASTGNNLVVEPDMATFDDNSLETTVYLNLANGKTYNIAFFAVSKDADGTLYDFSAEGQTITANYRNYTSKANLADAYDCFYTLYNTGVISSSSTGATVVLTRPVAQINWGTNDYEEPTIKDPRAFGDKGEYVLTNLTYDGYTTFSLIESDVVGQPEQLTIEALAAPTSETFPVEGYEYVAMQYVLAPKDAQLFKMALNISNGLNNNIGGNVTNDVVSVDNVPVQANYRTNIYGALLTNPFEYIVVKDPNWNTPDYNIETSPWNGKTVTYPQEVDGTYTVTRVSDVAGIAEMVKDGNTFAGKTVELASDFDFGGNEFPGIGAATRSGSSTTTGTTSFEGVFDGNGHTLSNIVINGTDNEDDAAGFIGNLTGANAALKNVTFDNLKINAPGNEQAGVVGIVTNGATVEGVTVNSGSVSSKEAAGGIVGRILASGTVQNCSNAASVSVSGYNAGGIVGAAYYTEEGTQMTISSCTNSGNVTSAGTAAGGIAGLSCATVDGCTNTGAVTGSGTSIGGVIGEQRSAGSVSDCVNAGVVKNNSTAYGTGGVIGWVRYDVSASYARRNMITVTGCYNYASVYGGTGVGGIVGVWYMSGECNGNFNYAPELVATGQFVAGIVGTSQWTETNWNGEKTGTLTVDNNQSSTTLANMKGDLAAEFIYINNTQMTTESGNQMVEPQTYPGK